MWFVFPQLAGLAASPMSQRYAIRSLGEARAYFAHLTLGPRLLDCTAAMLSHHRLSARRILGQPDDLKFCSSMTLFGQASDKSTLFTTALGVFFDGVADARTLERLGQINPASGELGSA